MRMLRTMSCWPARSDCCMSVTRPSTRAIRPFMSNMARIARITSEKIARVTTISARVKPAAGRRPARERSGWAMSCLLALLRLERADREALRRAKERDGARPVHLDLDLLDMDPGHRRPRGE